MLLPYGSHREVEKVPSGSFVEDGRTANSSIRASTALCLVSLPQMPRIPHPLPSYQQFLSSSRSLNNMEPWDEHLKKYAGIETLTAHPAWERQLILQKVDETDFRVCLLLNAFACDTPSSYICLGSR